MTRSGNVSAASWRAALALASALPVGLVACSVPLEEPDTIMARGGTGSSAGTSAADAGTSRSSTPTPTAPSSAADAGKATTTGTTTTTGSGSDAGSAVTVDESVILGQIAYGAFRASSAFAHVTSEPFPSAVATGSLIDEWVSYGAAAAYEALGPDGGAAPTTVPVGTVIVREVLDATGTVTELTLLAKGPPGYNPAIGDWWWGVTDPDGSPVTDDGGIMLGRLEQCYTCHIPNAAQDYLFGPPATDH